MTTRYLDYSGRDDVLSGGVRMVPVGTPAGNYRVWTKRIGSNPDLKLLLLHGGPGMTHESSQLARSRAACLGPRQPAIYVSMQGPSELGISADAKLATPRTQAWYRPESGLSSRRSRLR